MSATSFTLENICGASSGLSLHRQDFPSMVISEFAFDSRRLPDAPSTLFVALKGMNRDGHAFVADAYEKGVRTFLVSHPEVIPGPANVLVATDTLAALQEIAARHRANLPYPVVAITGSNGKTIVKEWLSSVLMPKFRIGKSPGSFNSQIGVPFSILDLGLDNDLALVEAGISKPGEMEKLKAVIQPDWGILTHFGDAHAEGFASEKEKLREKLSLFKGCKKVFMFSDNAMVLDNAKEAGLNAVTVGRADWAQLRVLAMENEGVGTRIRFQEVEDQPSLLFPFQGEAAIENVLLVILVARHLGMDWAEIQGELNHLYPVSMRTELISDNPDLSIINDAYNADRASLRNALAMLAADRSHPGKALILTDLDHLGNLQEGVQVDILKEVVSRFKSSDIYLIGPVFKRLADMEHRVRAFSDTQSFLDHFDYDAFKSKTVLLKGARRFELERIIPYLSRRAVSTWMKVNLDHLGDNFRTFRSHLPAGTRIMCMVKAFSYGSGTWEIAEEVARQGADYLAVAYTSEGIALRTRGIQTPIMVMNADTDSIEQLFRFRLEPEVYGLDFLRTYVRMGRSFGMDKMLIHLKVDTGMHRLGFSWMDTQPLRQFLAEHEEIEVASVLSHLSSADEPGLDAYTQEQIRRFDAFFAEMAFPEGQKPLRHILNTAGIIRFPQHAYEMVRLGIGLYGVSPLPSDPWGLKEIGSLHTVITQIHDYPPDTPIGYSCSEKTQRESRIATIPVGYADGIRRSLSNGVGYFLVHGKRAPVVGRVCMDMLMLDVTQIPEAQEGDEVVLTGRQGENRISVADIAGWCGTIPYEILTGISQRVRRVYVRE